MPDTVLPDTVSEEPRAKIEVLSDRTAEPLCEMDRNLIAIVTPSMRPMAVPNFDPNSIKPLADLIEREVIARS